MCKENKLLAQNGIECVLEKIYVYKSMNVNMHIFSLLPIIDFDWVTIDLSFVSLKQPGE